MRIKDAINKITGKHGRDIAEAVSHMGGGGGGVVFYGTPAQFRTVGKEAALEIFKAWKAGAAIILNPPGNLDNGGGENIDTVVSFIVEANDSGGSTVTLTAVYYDGLAIASVGFANVTFTRDEIMG